MLLDLNEIQIVVLKVADTTLLYKRILFHYKVGSYLYLIRLDDEVLLFGAIDEGVRPSIVQNILNIVLTNGLLYDALLMVIKTCKSLIINR